MQKVQSVTVMGLDSHRKFSVVTGRDSQARIVWRERLEHADRARLRATLAAWPREVPVVLEATFGWGWMSDELLGSGLRPHLASSTKVAAWRKARGLAKSNRIDADLLSELPQQDGQRWWEVWLAPPDVREAREWMRYRMTLVGLQSGLKNRVHAVLHRHGIVNEHADLFGVAGRRMLSLLTSGDARLPESGRATLKGYVQLLDHLRRQIAQATREIRRQVRRSPAGERLRTLPGISFILAYTILAEVGRIERFASHRQLASYSLLAPRAYDSGEEDPNEPPKGRHVGHAGRRTLKWAWIEASHSAVKHGGRFREIFDRRTNGGTRDRSRGYIAVAHELCRIAYAVWKQNRDYAESPPARPGSKSSRDPATTEANKEAETSRPGMGQPDPAMVVATRRRTSY
jgi:transposase